MFTMDMKAQEPVFYQEEMSHKLRWSKEGKLQQLYEKRTFKGPVLQTIEGVWRDVPTEE